MLNLFSLSLRDISAVTVLNPKGGHATPAAPRGKLSFPELHRLAGADIMHVLIATSLVTARV